MRWVGAFQRYVLDDKDYLLQFNPQRLKFSPNRPMETSKGVVESLYKAVKDRNKWTEIKKFYTALDQLVVLLTDPLSADAKKIMDECRTTEREVGFFGVDQGPFGKWLAMVDTNADVGVKERFTNTATDQLKAAGQQASQAVSSIGNWFGGWRKK